MIKRLPCVMSGLCWASHLADFSGWIRMSRRDPVCTGLPSLRGTERTTSSSFRERERMFIHVAKEDAKHDRGYFCPPRTYHSSSFLVTE